jgi:methylmalonyl-CoA/ethylmalonyl-CoA epimerase
MKILRVNHLGIVPKDSIQAASFFGDLLGLVHEGKETVEEQKVSVEFFRAEATRLELLVPTSSDSPIAKFLEAKGSGIQHVALEVDSLAEWLVHLKAKGVKLIDEQPRKGAHNTLIAFVHPHATGGILVELVQENKQ